MATGFADLRSAARTLRRSPAFTASAVLLLAVGIGATTALFSLVNAVVLRPLPFNDPHRLVEIWGRTDQRTGMRVPGEILDVLRTRATTLQAVGTHDPAMGVLATPEGPVEIRGEAVSANFAEVLGVLPVAGRPFVPEDARAGAAPVVLVSYAFWRRYLGGDANAVGQPINLDGMPYIVIGIMPPGFSTRFVEPRPSFWTPYAGSGSRERERELGYELVARLAPGATVTDARREIEALTSSAAFDEWRKGGRRIGLVPLTDEVVGNTAQALELLLAAAALALAVACANLAQLLLARSDHRLREFATRKALGASVVQLFRLALFESVLVAAAGGTAAVAIAYWLVPVMLSLAPMQIPRLAEASIDGRVLAMAAAVSLLTACLFGLAPAAKASRVPLAQATRPGTGAASPQRRRLRSALVVVQVAVAVVLFVLAGLVAQTFLTLLPTSPGFEAESRAAFVWSLSERQFPDAVERRRRIEDWIARLEATPGILSAGVGTRIPFGDDDAGSAPVRRAEDDRPPGEATLRAEVRGVSPNFFQLLGIPLVYGRSFDGTDRGEAPRVAVVNETLARRLEPSGNVLGRSIRVGSAATAPVYEIVGVAADTRWWGMTLEPLNVVYTPFAQDRAYFGFVIAHSRLDTGSLTRAIRSAFHASLPGAPLPADRSAVPLSDMIGRSVAGPRFSSVLIGGFAALTLLLAAIGLFGLVAYSVVQRRREIGIRIALGARPIDLIVMTMRSSIVLTVFGIAAGALAATYVSRFVESQLYAIERLDATTFAGAAIVMLATAALATYLPARRAAFGDPMRSLRYD
jgi:putative ABC transport system permease protein